MGNNMPVVDGLAATRQACIENCPDIRMIGLSVDAESGAGPPS